MGRKGYFDASISSRRYDKSGNCTIDGEGLITLISNSSPGNRFTLVEDYISRNKRKISDGDIEAALDLCQIKYRSIETKEEKIERLLKHLRFR